jgi:hypothetical protein
MKAVSGVDKLAFSPPLDIDTSRRSRAASLVISSSTVSNGRATGIRTEGSAGHGAPTLEGPDSTAALCDRHAAWDFQNPWTGEVQEAYVLKPPDANAMPVLSSSRRRVTFDERLPGTGAAGEHYAEIPVSDIRLPGSGGRSVVEQFEGGTGPGSVDARRPGVDAVLGATRKEPKALRPLVTWANDVTPGLVKGDETDHGPLGDRTTRDAFIDGGAHSKHSRHRFQPPSGVGDLQSATATSGHVNETNSTARMLPVASRVPELRETGASVPVDDGRATRAIVSHSPSATAATTSVVSTLKSQATMKAGDAVPTSRMRAERSKFTGAMSVRGGGGAELASARRGDETKRPSPALQRFSHAIVDGITPGRSDGLVGVAPTTSRHAHEPIVLSTAPVRYDMGKTPGVALVSSRATGNVPTTRRRADFGSHTLSARPWHGGASVAPISVTGRVDTDDAASDTVTSRRAGKTDTRLPETHWDRHVPVAVQRASLPKDPSDRGGRRLLPPVYVSPRATRVVQDGARAIGSVVDSSGWTGNKEPYPGAVDREPLSGGSWATGAVNLRTGSAPPLMRADPGSAPANNTARERGVGNGTGAGRVGTRDAGATGWRLDSRAAITASPGTLSAFGFEQNGANETGSTGRTDRLRQADTVASTRWGSVSHDLSGRVITQGDRVAGLSEYGEYSEGSDDDQGTPFPATSSRLPTGFAETVFGSGRVPKTDAPVRGVAREANDLAYTPLSQTVLMTSARHAVSAPTMRDSGGDFSRYSTVF